jgi:hypothetical protein
MEKHMNEKYSKDYSISIEWSVSDVLDLDPTLTLQQCVQVLNWAARKHDASIGINHDVLEFYIGQVKALEKEKEEK